MNSTYGAATAETQYVDTASARFAHRRIGSRTGVRLVLVHRFRATLDWWDSKSHLPSSTRQRPGV